MNRQRRPSYSLLQACRESNLDLVRTLLDRRVDLEEVDWQGNTPLCLAADMSTPCVLYRRSSAPDLQTAKEVKTRIAVTLLRRRANIHHINQDGNTALSLAANTGNAEMVRLLIRHGARLDHRNHQGKTALCLAVAKSNLNPPVSDVFTATVPTPAGSEHDVVSQLINAGAKLDCRDQDGRTALHTALMNKRNNGARRLMNAGADTALTDRNGHTVLSYFLKYNPSVAPWEFEDSVSFILDKITLKGPDFHLLILRNLGWIKADHVLKDEGKTQHHVLPSLEYFFNEDDLPSGMSSLKGQGLTPFFCALLVNDQNLARFFVSNWFLHAKDLNIQSYDVVHLRETPRFNRCVQKINLFLTEMFCQPWTLQSLCFVHVSTCVGFGPFREERVKTLPLPNILKAQLMFKTSHWRAVRSTWSELTFSAVHGPHSRDCPQPVA